MSNPVSSRVNPINGEVPAPGSSCFIERSTLENPGSVTNAFSKIGTPASSLWLNKRFNNNRPSGFPANQYNGEVFLCGSVVFIARRACKNAGSAINPFSKRGTPASLLYSNKRFNNMKPSRFPVNQYNGEVFLSGSVVFIAKRACKNAGSAINAFSKIGTPSSFL